MPLTANIPLASGSFLISPNVGLMIWTLVVFAISLAILRRFVFPADRQSSRRARAEDRRRHRRRRAAADRGRSDPRRIPRAPQGGSHPVRGDRPARAPDREVARGRGQGARAGARRRGGRAGRARNRGGHEAGARGDPSRGRRPDDPGHREGHAQVAHRRRPAAARRGGARRTGLLRHLREPELDGGAGPGICTRAVRGGPRTGQARRAARTARAAGRRAAREQGTGKCSSSPPTSPPRRSRRGSASCWTAPMRCC